MKKRIIVIFLLTALTVLSAMGNKPAGAEFVSAGMTFQLDRVEMLSAGSDWELILQEGPRAELTIDSAPDSRGWMDYDGSSLRFGVESRPGINVRRRSRKATLTLPVLPEELRASSSSRILVEMDGEREKLFLHASSSGSIALPSLKTEDLIVRISSSGEIALEKVHTDGLDADLSSSAELIIGEGSAAYLEAGLSSSARLEGRDFTVIRSCSVNGSSSSRLEIALAETAEIGGSLSSSSRLIIHGDPRASRLQDIRLSSSAGIDVRP